MSSLDSIYWMEPVKNKMELKQPFDSNVSAACLDESKKDGVWIFIYKNGKWAEDSVLFAYRTCPYCGGKI